jgi:hypothetical protein
MQIVSEVQATAENVRCRIVFENEKIQPSAKLLLDNLKLQLTQSDYEKSNLKYLELKAAILKFFDPPISGSQNYSKQIYQTEVPQDAISLYQASFNFFKTKNDFRSLNELINAYLIFIKKFKSSYKVFSEMINSIDFILSNKITFPTTTYHTELPVLPLIIITRLRYPEELYIMDIHISVPRGDSYWSSSLLKELFEITQKHSNATKSLPMVRLIDPLDGHKNKFNYFSLSDNNSFTAGESDNCLPSLSDSLSAPLIYLSQHNNTNENLKTFLRGLRVPIGQTESDLNLDETKLISFRIMSSAQLTVNDGEQILDSAILNLKQSIPKIGHGGYKGALNRVLALFETDKSKSAIHFQENSTLTLASEMGFEVSKRQKIISQLEVISLKFLNDEKNIFSLFRPLNSITNPSEDSKNQAAIIRLLDGFYKQISSEKNGSYLELPKKVQAWIEKKFFSFLFSTGNWPFEEFKFTEIYKKEYPKKNFTLAELNESLQQYLISTSQKILLIRHEEGLYFLKGSTPTSIRVIGITHDFDDPLVYLYKQNNKSDFKIINLTILSPRQKKGYIENVGPGEEKNKIITQSPLLFVAEISINKQ